MVEAAAVSAVSSILICLLTGLIGVERDWPDFAHTDYGLPIPWRTHVTSTIAGPTDETKYDLVGLVTDLVFWAIIIGSVVISLFLMSQSAPLKF